MSGKSRRRGYRERLPRRGTTLEEILRCFERQIAAKGRNNLHPRFFGYVSGAANPVAVFAEALCSALNQNVTSWRSAPSAVELEHLVTGWFKEMLGYPRDSFGLLTSGGSMATLGALAIARTAAAGNEVITRGVRTLGEKHLLIFASDQVHMSVAKAAELLGLGRESLRLLESDSKYRLDPASLDNALKAARKQRDIPMCVVANTGSVSAGAIDPLGPIAEVCERRKVWLHVDAAYGGFAALSRPVRKLMRGIGQADSVSLDPHKWLYQPLVAGCLLVRERAHAYATFSGSAGEYTRVFLSDPGEAFTFFEHGIELSRRLRALKIWMSLEYYGTERVTARIERNIASARYIESLIEASDELELLAPVELSIFCFRYVPTEIRGKLKSAAPAQAGKINEQLDALNQRLMTELQRGGVAYLSNAVLRGRFALRGCVISYRTRNRDLQITRDEVLRLGRRLWKQAPEES